MLHRMIASHQSSCCSKWSQQAQKREKTKDSCKWKFLYALIHTIDVGLLGVATKHSDRDLSCQRCLLPFSSGKLEI